MSFTLTSTTHTTYGSILLSPSKRRPGSADTNDGKAGRSLQELWKWTLSSAAVAPCFIRDAMEMRANTQDGYDFFWLGRIPCRSVEIVGIVVGLQTYEKRIVYSVDDGTSVIDCAHTSMPPPPRTPSKRNQTKPTPRTTLKPLPLPIPKAWVGDSVRIVGKVRQKYETRQLFVDVLERCSSPNDELHHWRTVRSLHKTSYSLSEPFVPPLIVPSTPSKTRTQITGCQSVVPDTPSTIAGTPGSVIADNTSRSEYLQSSPQKLRHPSRLHSRDLTANTFRIYLKHYMDNTPDVGDDIGYKSTYDSDILINKSLAYTPSTPTGRTRHSLDLRTPRLKAVAPDTDSTPRARELSPGFNISRRIFLTDGNTHTSILRGFSFSYLRRVPELRQMATNVVKAEFKRRYREERKREKESGNTQGHKKHSLKPEELRIKVKRLFRWAIVELLKEGGIILWDGPVRPIPHKCVSDTSGLWKANASSTSTALDDSTTFSSNRLSQESQEDDVSEYLSDPEPAEEAYLPLKITYLASQVESTIKLLSNVQHDNPKVVAGGSTTEAILAFLRKDDRWRYLGRWNIEEALELLRIEGRAWDIGKGRWDLTVS